MVDTVPFSSTRKWASATVAPAGTDASERYVLHLGAPDVLLPTGEWTVARERVAELAAEGRRILVVTRSTHDPDPPSDQPDGQRDVLPSARLPLCLLLLEDTVKADSG